MFRHLAAAALAMALAANAYAQQPDTSKPRADAPDTRGLKIDEAHRTSPDDKPRGEAAAAEEEKKAAAGSSRQRPDVPDTRGLEIDEAHRAAPDDLPKKRYEKP